METLKLKTNINCSGCVAKITSSLNETVGENNWKVDTQNPNKILTVSGTEVNKNDVVRAVEKAGFKAEEVA
ncbi:Copper chaperone CopZ [Hydrobacter penzbergensis]|jgi:copper chaperone|uniref:Copper chaperone CopZ n=1 Tax=Hydrobacter penzbergensis TaxID=1235997 RepID=A0A8X8ICZ4_9BACT|nr:heavy-metal-associated domain-containing protein [Hydrobacter penzbergensis]MBN8717973.1 heavy-metal-associated domain-containing protein [Sediminibacterium magnilacihabitans]PQV61567.1 copper chaperone CopZ [Sediminibacterium magnilacihabitans]SDW14951.1 Copper chaperone CopZ [Hydrobacter penzbergensis]